MESRGPGRPSKEILVGEVRSITHEELAELNRTPVSTDVQELTDRHIAMARLVAAGYSNQQIAATLGVTPQRVSQLRTDPLFRAMVENFKENAKESLDALLERLSTLAGTGLRKLLDKFETEELSVAATADLTFKALDRLGYGPTQKTMNLNVGVNGMEALKAALDAKERVRRT